jgi:Fur family peroxide stress response transcriptional regulator
MIPPYASLTTSLKQAGLRLTPQRIAICRFLAESNQHPTAAMIYEHLRPQYPSLSPMTVYNTLKTLVELGQVNALGHAGDDTVHYDADTSPHINLACIRCHRIVDIPCDCLTDLDENISRASGYQLLGARMMFYGLCPACQSSKVS